jgi:hypothetical protein
VLATFGAPFDLMRVSPRLRLHRPEPGETPRQQGEPDPDHRRLEVPIPADAHQADQRGGKKRHGKDYQGAA